MDSTHESHLPETLQQRAGGPPRYVVAGLRGHGHEAEAAAQLATHRNAPGRTPTDDGGRDTEER